jgi:hypothetical protein
MPAREARAQSSVPSVAPPSPSTCWVFQSPLVRRSCVTLRCDVPQRVASRTIRFPTHKSVQGHRSRSAMPSGCLPRTEAPGSAFPPDIDHLAKCGRVRSTDLRRRGVSGADIPRLRNTVGFRDLIDDTAPRIARPLGQARKSAFITVGTLQVPLPPPASLPVGSEVLSARAHPNSHNPSGTLGE